MNKKRTIVKDHLGNEYPSTRAMCKAYGVDQTTFNSRIKLLGWTLEEALCGKKVVDHLGNEYPSVIVMCEAYDIDPITFNRRIRLGWILEEALCGKLKVVDHLGNKYPTKTDMCKVYGINRYTFDSRIERGMTLEEALTTPVDNENSIIVDHLGNEYSTTTVMCDFYNIDATTFYGRIKRGMTLEEALTTPKATYVTKDHLGNEYPTIPAMCEAYKISKNTFQRRIKDGWTLEKTLTTPITICVKDYLGNEYPSVKAMCDFYNINATTFNDRIKSGWTLEEALTIPKNMKLGEKKVMDVLEKRNILCFHDVTINKALKMLGIKADFDVFIEEFQKVLEKEAGITWSISKIKRLRPDFILYKNDTKAITGVIEYDGGQHQNFIEYFFKTIEKFLERNEADFVKNSLWEYLNIPMLRIRDDQIGLIEEMVDDFLAHPEKYLTKHNTYLSEEEYWAPLIENYGDLDIAFSF